MRRWSAKSDRSHQRRRPRTRFLPFEMSTSLRKFHDIEIGTRQDAGLLVMRLLQSHVAFQFCCGYVLSTLNRFIQRKFRRATQARLHCALRLLDPDTSLRRWRAPRAWLPRAGHRQRKRKRAARRRKGKHRLLRHVAKSLALSPSRLLPRSTAPPPSSDGLSTFSPFLTLSPSAW